MVYLYSFQSKSIYKLMIWGYKSMITLISGCVWEQGNIWMKQVVSPSNTWGLPRVHDEWVVPITNPSVFAWRKLSENCHHMSFTQANSLVLWIPTKLPVHSQCEFVDIQWIDWTSLVNLMSNALFCWPSRWLAFH